jgi:exonuclease SbcC
VINTPAVLERLKEHYPSLEKLSEVVLRGVDVYEGRPYAIRYFDLSDDIVSVASRLREYQERILGDTYFDPHSKADLRWNHYVYFIASPDTLLDIAAAGAKAAIEADREYARKLVLTETELGDVLDARPGNQPARPLPPDPITEWAETLERHALGFVVDEALQVPAVVRHIANGDRQGLRRPPAAPELSDAERQIAKDVVKTLRITQFRQHPVRREYDFGIVNLITGVNGVGKTSLLEAIEYFFCGRVRRSRGAPPKASVAGVLARSGLELETRASTPDARLRARHLHWYGKADVRAVTLDESFGKFNFLDTDAAVRLTVETSRERINADLAQLLLGAEAAKTLERFERLSKALMDRRRDLERDIQIRDQRRLDATTRLQELRSSPQESDQLFRHLITTLGAVGWRKQPSDKHEAESVAGNAQSALVNIGVLKAAGSAVPRDRTALTNMRAQLAAATAAVEKAIARKRALDRTEAETKQNARTVDVRSDAVARLLPMLDAGLVEIAKDLDEKKERAVALATSLKEAEPAARTVAELHELAGKSIRHAIEDSERQAEQRATELNNARRSLDGFARTQASLTNLAQQLRSVARQIVEHTHDETHCPLCVTQLERIDLQACLRESVESASGEEALRLRQHTQDAELGHQRAVTVLQGLRTLSAYQTTASGRTTLGALLTRIGRDREELLKLQTEIRDLRLRIQEQERQGWTIERLAAVADEAGIDPSVVNRASIEGLNDVLTRQRAEYLAALNKHREDRQKAVEELEEIAREFGLPLTQATQLLAALSERMNLTEQVRRAIDALAQEVNLDSAPADLELEAQLREGHEAAVRVHTAVVKERTVSETAAKEARIIEEAAAEVAALRVQVARVDSALNVMTDLIEKQSGQALIQQVLRENGTQIAATFGRIHAPSEFDVEVNDDGLKIVRRSTKTNVELDEMSSGQRAAFALSLFLAMNGRLRTGPTAIIFDDPVAHVDEINTLSFMDYLREIALEGDRQIFFATANSKLAGLFVRKFRFMGDQFKQIALARDS